MMKRLSLLLVLLGLPGVSAYAVETNITILGVQFPGASSAQSGFLLSQVASIGRRQRVRRLPWPTGELRYQFQHRSQEPIRSRWTRRS